MKDSIGNHETGDEPAIVIVRGKHYRDSEELYEKYRLGCKPLLRKYGVQIVAIGSGCESCYTTEIYPGCLILQFPNVRTADDFFNDPEYIFLKENYRDKVYEEIHISLFRLQGLPEK